MVSVYILLKEGARNFLRYFHIGERDTRVCFSQVSGFLSISAEFCTSTLCSCCHWPCKTPSRCSISCVLSVSFSFEITVLARWKSVLTTFTALFWPGCTVVLTVDTVNKQTNITNRTEICQESQLVAGWPAGYLQSAEELNSVPPFEDKSI